MLVLVGKNLNVQEAYEVEAYLDGSEDSRDVAELGDLSERGLAVRPVTGAALLWFNMLPNGRMDRASRHAGCPVTKGDKWIATRWMHSVPFERKR